MSGFPFPLPEDKEGMPVPSKHEREHQFVCRCLTHFRLSKKIPSSKDRATYARVRYTKRDERDYTKGKKEEAIEEMEQGETRVPITGILGERGGEVPESKSLIDEIAEKYSGVLPDETSFEETYRHIEGPQKPAPKTSGLKANTQGEVEKTTWNPGETHRKKARGRQQVADTMTKFKEGTLVTAEGNPVTDKDQAMTLAMDETPGMVKKAKGGGKGKVEKVMSEFKHGTLKSGSGHKVEDRDQAIAIAMSEAGMSKPKNR
jgi:hypothetical protein